MQCCPRLIVQFKDRRSPTEIYGPHKICEYLKQKNEEIRSATVSIHNIMCTYIHDCWAVQTS